MPTEMTFGTRVWNFWSKAAMPGLIACLIALFSVGTMSPFIKETPEGLRTHYVLGHLVLVIFAVWAVVRFLDGDKRHRTEAMVVSSTAFAIAIFPTLIIAGMDEFGWVAQGKAWQYAMLPWMVFATALPLAFIWLAAQEDYMEGASSLTGPMRIVLALLAGLSAWLVCLHSGTSTPLTGVFVGVFALIGFVDFSQRNTMASMVAALLTISIFDGWFGPIALFIIFVVVRKIGDWEVDFRYQREAKKWRKQFYAK